MIAQKVGFWFLVVEIYGVSCLWSSLVGDLGDTLGKVELEVAQLPFTISFQFTL